MTDAKKFILQKKMTIINSVCLILCLSGVICVQLESLCPDDFFDYKGHLVNGFYRVDQIADLPAVRYFIIAEWSSFRFFMNKTRYPDSDLRGEMEAIKRDLKHKIKSIYSEYYLNGARYDQVQSERKFFDSIWQRIEKVKRKTHPADLMSFQEIVFGVQGRPEALINYLLPFQANQLQPNDMNGLQPNKYAQMEALREIVRDLDVNANQTMVFENDFIEEIYKQPIVSRPRFTFNRASKVLYDVASYGTLKYQIVLPFHDKLYDHSRPCVSSFNLPRFFLQKAVRSQQLCRSSHRNSV